MKRYKITINGQAYDVSVEEIGSARAAAPVVSAPVAPAPVSAAPAPVSAAPVAGGSGTVRAPMPGTVTSLKVGVGQQVKRGDVVLLLEAMKMENEIVATADGAVSSIAVSAGQSVNTNDVMLVIG